MTKMTFEEYEMRVIPLVLSEPIGMDGLIYASLGLNEEAGEVAGALKKFMRGDYDQNELHCRLTKELGDVLWYAARLAREIGVPLEIVAQVNINKVTGRTARGTIKGDGDDR